MKSNNTIGQRILVLLVVIVAIAGGAGIWWTDGTRAVDPADQEPFIFVVARGQGVRDIAADLSENNLIRSPTAFFLLVKLMGIERNLQAGDFRLNRAMTAREIAEELTHGFLDVWVTIPEGWRVEEVAARVAKELDIPEAEFLKVAQEGYMFPDTYLIPRDATPAAIAKIFINNFNSKVTAEMRQQVRDLGLTFEEVLTLASIVEREGRTDSDRPVIAGILLKRLRAGWPLQTDATLQYILGYQAGEKSWWKKTLTTADKKLKSPYNTYLNAGLPPGPIANPGLAAIKAVLSSQESPYWYYLHDSAGLVHYARTLEEQTANIAKYLE